MIFFVVPNGFQFPYIPVYNDQRGERIAAGNGEDVDEGFLGHRHTDGIARVVQQRVVFPVTGNPHVIHKQGDVLENGFVSMAVRYTAAACFRLGLHAGTKFSSASTDSRNNARRHVPVPL